MRTELWSLCAGDSNITSLVFLQIIRIESSANKKVLKKQQGIQHNRDNNKYFLVVLLLIPMSTPVKQKSDRNSKHVQATKYMYHLQHSQICFMLTVINKTKHTWSQFAIIITELKFQQLVFIQSKIMMFLHANTILTNID